MVYPETETVSSRKIIPPIFFSVGNFLITWRHPNGYQYKRVPKCLVFNSNIKKTCHFLKKKPHVHISAAQNSGAGNGSTNYLGAWDFLVRSAGKPYMSLSRLCSLGLGCIISRQTMFKGIAKGGVRDRSKGGCKRLSTFARVRLRLFAFSPLGSPLRLSTLSAFVGVCLKKD